MESVDKTKASKKSVNTLVASDPSLPEKAFAALTAAADKKGENLKLLDLRELTSLADYFIIVSALTDRQVLAIARNIEDQMREKGYRPLHVEGLTNGRWVVLDYGDLVVHVFQDAIRDFYDLDGLWAHAPRIPVPMSVYLPSSPN